MLAQAMSRVVLILVLIGCVAAQQSVIIAPNCSLPTYNWTSNSLGQDVCHITGFALEACQPGTINIPPLASSTNNYQGPTGSDDGDICKCNSVLYSLIMACGECQGGMIITYDQWKTNCTNTAPEGTWPADQVGFPNNTAIPAWAFQSIPGPFDLWDNTTSFTFFQTNRSEITSLPGPTSTASSATASSTGSATPSASPSQPAAGASHSGGSHAGAIAGGVVGGIVGAALLGALVWYLIRRNRRRVAPSAAYRETENLNSAPTFIGEGASVGPSTRKYYDPSDPSTFPDASLGGAGSSTGMSSPGPTINTTHQPGHKTMPSYGGSEAGDNSYYRGLPEV